MHIKMVKESDRKSYSVNTKQSTIDNFVESF